MSAKSFLKRDDGAAAVEFSLVAPVFLLMLFVIFRAGWVAYSANDVQYALSQSARAVQLKPAMTQSQLQNLVRSKLSLGQDASKVTVTISYQPLDAKTKLANATATFPLVADVPLLNRFAITYTAKTTFALVN